MQGKLCEIDNINPKRTSARRYLFTKVQLQGLGEAFEEYLLVTPGEALRFRNRALRNPEDVARWPLGVLASVVNKKPFPTAARGYDGVRLKMGCEEIGWLITASELERVRRRVEKNREDIEANKEGWLADLFD